MLDGMRYWKCGARFVVVACFAATWMGQSASAEEPKKPDKKACFQAHEQGQIARGQRKLRKAAEHFAVCAHESCPKVASEECVKWLAEVRPAIPTFALVVFDKHGQETSDVKVLLDDEPLTEKIEKKNYEVDPGQHTLRFELADGSTIEEKFEMGPGESGKRITGDFSRLVQKETKKAAPVTAKPSRPVPVATWILGGLSVVALGSFATFAILGKNKETELKDNCAPNCKEADVNVMDQRYLLADISLGAGVLALGAATVLFVTRKPVEKEQTTTRLEVIPGRGAGMVRWTARF
jgi:hypothetical protein